LDCNVKYTLDIKWFCLIDIPDFIPTLIFCFFLYYLCYSEKTQVINSFKCFFFFCVSFNFSLTSDLSLPRSHLVGNQNMRKNNIKNWTVPENIDAATSAGFAFMCSRWFLEFLSSYFLKYIFKKYIKKIFFYCLKFIFNINTKKKFKNF
jgi:hypothetical protein